MTRVDLPVFVYGASAVIKLNEQLVLLGGHGDGRYGSDGLEVMVRPLEEAREDGGLFLAELVMRHPEESNELGFHGFSECE